MTSLKSTLLAFGLGLAVLCPNLVLGQGLMTLNGTRSDEVLVKVQKIDLLVHLLPLALRKDQFDPLLLAVEKARQFQKKTLSNEDDYLTKLDPEITEALKNALEKGAYPPPAMQTHAKVVFTALRLNRQFIAGLMENTIYDAITAKSGLDAGQLKVMENSLDPYLIDPTIKKDSLDGKGKIHFFIRRIFLDALTYDLLVQLQKNAQ